MRKYGNSSYWLSEWDDDDIITSTMNKAERKTNDIYKLASTKRAISNFVNIVTNKQIPVKFNQRGDSYTDGKTVVIGSNVVKPTDFDVSVGLALHEGSHIKLSDFKLLADIGNLVPTTIKDDAIRKGVYTSLSIIKDIWNVVEDRRIDRYVFDSAPGYRDYYRAMYDKYFNDKLVDKALQSDEHTDITVDSYMFRIINIHNKNSDLDVLPGLREIYNEIGLGTISRLNSSLDSFNVALKVFQIILNNLSVDDDDNGEGESNSDNQQSTDDSNGNGSGTGNDTSDEPRDMTDDEFEALSDSLDADNGGDGNSENGGGSGMTINNAPDLGGTPTEPSNSKNSNETEVKLTDRQKELLQKKIEKQKKFMDGDIRKKTITKKDANDIDAIEESGSDVTTVATDLKDGWGRVSKGIQCIVVKRLTRSLLESSVFPLTRNLYYGDNEVIHSYYENQVSKGIKLGTLLGKKLQIRGEDRNTVYNRQKHGRIDKRMISSLGFGNENVFQYIETDSYKKANLHISIDASGSMGGSKWKKTLTNVVALCKAVDMIQNLSIQVSIRTTTENGTSVPYIVMVYDSRTDKFSKVKQMFPYLKPYGTTPEGLCFEAIMNEFLPSNNDLDSYFLNISDGEPYFQTTGLHYYGDVGFNHTRKMVKKIENLGVKTLSFYVTDYSYGSNEPSYEFKKMYGNGARKVDITNISQISKTMNQLFLEK